MLVDEYLEEKRRGEVLAHGSKEEVRELLGVGQDYGGTPPQQRRMTLSVACITAGEDSMYDMFDSIEKIADEVVIVSSDDSGRCIGLDRCENVKQHYRNWTDDFAAARNFAFSKCTGDYILWLDSDDVVPPESAEMIRAALDNPGPKTLDKSVFFCFQLMEPGQEGIGISQPRMTPNLPGIKWTGRIHETHTQSLLDMGLNSVVVDNIHVVHSGYQDRESLKEKVRNRNIPMLEKEEDSPHKFYHLGQSKLILDDPGKALTAFRRCREFILQPEFSDHVDFQIGICYYEMGELTRAKDVFRKSGLPEALYYRGMIRKRRGAPKEATEYFEQFLETKPKVSWWGTNYKAMRKDSYRQMMDIQMGPVREIQKRAQSEFPKKQQ